MSLAAEEECDQTVESCDTTVPKLMDAHPELSSYQDPRNLGTCMEGYNVELQGTPAHREQYKHTQDLLVEARSHLGEYLRGATSPPHASHLPAMDQAEGRSARDITNSTDHATQRPATERSSSPVVANRHSIESVRVNRRPRASVEHDHDDNPVAPQEHNAKRRKTAHEAESDDKCTRCQRMNVPCIRQARGRTCKLCAEAHTTCERVNSSAIATIRQDLLDMHRKYEDTMLTLTRVMERSMDNASSSLKAIEFCSALKTRLDEFIPRTIQTQLALDNRLRTLETFITTHTCGGGPYTLNNPDPPLRGVRPSLAAADITTNSRDGTGHTSRSKSAVNGGCSKESSSG